MAKKKKTGLVCTIEKVPEEHQVGIIWTSNAAGEQVGFVYDEGEMLRNEIAGRVARFCGERGFGIADELEEGWTGKAKIEEVNQETFFDWFGGYPDAPELFFDSWGKSDDYRRIYGIPDGYAAENNAEYRRKSRKSGLKAGVFTAITFCAVAALLCLVSLVIADGAPFVLSAYTLLTIILIGLGIIFVLAEMQNLARYFYRKQMKKN